MTDIEKFLYQIMSSISEANAPIVFKGAMITKLILAEHGYTSLERVTKDIDANWIGEPPSMDVLVETINDSFGELKSRIYAVPFREYGEKMSAGISVRDKETDEEIVSMDIDMRPILGSKLYHIGEVGIRGVLATEILADKISVISSKMIFRRAKDLIDVYALTHCVKVNTSEIFDIYKKNPNREVGAFDEFYNRRSDVKHAYDKLRGVENKPPFDRVYNYLSVFIQPFVNKEMKPKKWDSKDFTWKDSNNKERVKSKNSSDRDSR
jgi:hypothetical protein